MAPIELSEVCEVSTSQEQARTGNASTSFSRVHHFHS